MRRLLRAIAIDIGPLRRHRDFRLLFTGQAVSSPGSMITYVAIPFQVYELTGSTLAVGLLGIAELVPLLVTALLGGALADAHDRRRLVLIADTVLLAARARARRRNALLADPHVWLLSSSRRGCRPPAACSARRSTRCCRGSCRATSCRRRRRSTASAGTRRRSPGRRSRGVLIATLGPRRDLRGRRRHVPRLARGARAHARRPAAARRGAAERRADPRGLALRALAPGARSARYAVDINAMLFGIPVALFPAVADRYGGPELLGLLYAAEPVGATAVHARQRLGRAGPAQGRRSRVSAAAYGAAIIVFGLAGLARRSRWSRSPRRAPRTCPRGSSARRCGTRRSRTRCAGAWRGSSSSPTRSGRRWAPRAAARVAVGHERALLDRVGRRRVRRRHGRAVRAAAALLALRGAARRVSA